MLAGASAEGIAAYQRFTPTCCAPTKPQLLVNKKWRIFLSHPDFGFRLFCTHE